MILSKEEFQARYGRGKEQNSAPSTPNAPQRISAQEFEDRYGSQYATSTTTPEKNKNSVLNFLEKDLRGTSTTKDTPAGLGGVGASIYKNTLGSSGFSGLAQSPLRPIATKIRAEAQTDIHKSRQDLAESADKFLELARGTSDEVQKKKYLSLASQTLRQSENLKSQAEEVNVKTPQSTSNLGDVKRVSGQAINTALTAFPFARGSGVIKSVLKQPTLGARTLTAAKEGAAYGAGFGAAGALADEKSARDVATESAVGAVTGGVLGGALPAVLGGAKKAFSNFPNISPIKKTPARVTKAIDDLEDKYKDIERGWIQTKKASEKAARVTQSKNKSGTVGRAPERVLAESGIIPEHQGTQFTTRGQAAKLREEVTPLSRANRAALKEAQLSTQPIPVDEFERRVIERARSSDNVAGGSADALEQKIKSEMQGYKRNYGDTIELLTLDDIKSARWKQSRFSLTREDKLAGDTDYLIAKAAQELIEETAAKAGANDVAQLNREIGDILEASKFLENLDGKRVLYGRMGTHMLRLSGAIIGFQGGPLGTLAGMMGGNVVASILRSTAIASPVKRLILKDLERTSPEAYKATLRWLEKQGLARELRLALPSGKRLNGEINQGRPIRVLPKGSSIDYTGTEDTVAHSQGNSPSTNRLYKAQRTNTIITPSNESPNMGANIPRTSKNSKRVPLVKKFLKRP